MNQDVDDLDLERKAIERGGRLHWFHWLVIFLSLVLTIAAWHISKKSIEAKNALEFERQASHTVELVVERLSKYADALWAGVATVQAHGGDIDYANWLTFANSLRINEKYPGISGIGIIHHVPPAELQSYLKLQRQNRPDFKIHPEHNKNEFWPITFIEPAAQNAQAIGLDMAHEMNRYKAALQARDSGVAQITAPIILVQDHNQTPGFLFYAPFYKGGRYSSVSERRQHFTGLVYAPFVVSELMAGTLQKEKRNVGIKILDGRKVLYNEYTSNIDDFDRFPLFQKSFEVDLYGRSWVFDIRSTMAFRANANNSEPLVILIGGIIIETLLLTLFIMLTHSNRRAIHYIERMSSNEL